jgi:hypothetical protein
MQPTPEVFDLFAVPAHAVPVRGGQKDSVRAGDLVLSAGRDASTADWLNPVLARLAVELDNQRPRSLRIAMPIPARDLRWVVNGWSASRYEPEAFPCHDLDVLLATGRLLHAHLAAVVTERPAELSRRDDRSARADRQVFGADPPAEILGDDLAAELTDGDLGPDQLVHGELARSVLLDAAGVPVVIDVAPYWRPALWADALCMLDAVLWLGTDPRVMSEWAGGARRQAMLRAALFRLASDWQPDVARYREVLVVPKA